MYYITISGPVDDRMAKTLVMQMMYLEAEDPTKVHVERTHSILHRENTFCIERTHTSPGPQRERTRSTQREHILYRENTHPGQCRENTFYTERTCSMDIVRTLVMQMMYLETYIYIYRFRV